MWAGTATGFVRDDAAKVYDGPSPVFLHILAGSTTRFYRVAHYDKLGKTGLNESSELTATSILAGGVTTVAALPAATYLGQDVVYYGGGTTPDFKLYRWNGTAYIRAADGGDLLAASVTSDKITVASLSAMSANLGSILSGNITMDAAGFIRGGSTGYLTGAGFWMGYHSGQYKFHIGDPTGQYMAWTGTGLTINAGGTFSGALSAATGSFAGSLSAATGTFGAMTVAAGGNIKMGQTAYNVGAGFWLGDDAGTAKFSLGSPDGDYFAWDGDMLRINAYDTYAAGEGLLISTGATLTVVRNTLTDLVKKAAFFMYEGGGVVTVKYTLKTSAVSSSGKAELRVGGVVMDTFTTTSTAGVLRQVNISVPQGSSIELWMTGQDNATITLTGLGVYAAISNTVVTY